MKVSTFPDSKRNGAESAFVLLKDVDDLVFCISLILFI